MTVTKAKLARLVEATLRDSYGHRDEILEQAGERPWKPWDYPEEVTVSEHTTLAHHGSGPAPDSGTMVKLTVHTGRGQRFELRVYELDRELGGELDRADG